MSVIVAKSAGFCSGVKKAIELAESIPGGCQTLGKLIHNNKVIKELEASNIFSIDSFDEYKGGKLVIRSHGIGKDIYKKMDELGIDYVDATCPFVKKIHTIVNEYYNQGYKIIIVGDKTHPEVIGINGWCNYEGIVVDNIQDLNLDVNDKYCMVSQTTFDYKDFVNIANYVEKTCKIVVNNNTICYTTTCRQEQADDLSKKCDVMLVIGSKISSNTNKLYRICKKNCPNTYYIETISDLKSVSDKKFINAGIVAGASTPQGLIEEVKTLMSESQETKNVVEDVKKESFENLYNNENNKKAMSIKAGQIHTCTIIKANEEGITVSFGGKKDGFIDKNEVEIDGITYDPANYKEGDLIKAKMIERSAKDGTGLVCFSKRAIDQNEKDWEDSEALLKQDEFKAVVTEVAKQGLKAKVGPFDIFVPASQIKAGYVTEEDLQKYLGKPLRLRVIKSNKDTSEGEVEIKRKRTVYASQRVILEEEKAKKEEEIWSFFEEGKIVTGKVVRIRDFGAFVKVNGFECLAHKSNLSYKKDALPQDVVEEGKSYEFIVLKVDREKRQVALGYKQLQKSLYEQAFEKYPVGSIITGPVRNITPYGVYVYIEDGVDGLVPIGEISRDYVRNPGDYCKEGQDVTAQVIKFDVEKNKITLSIKALLPEEEKIEEVEYSEEDVKASNDKRNQRNLKKFDTSSQAQPEAGKRRKTAKAKDDAEPTSWTTETKSVSIGDLIKNLVDIDE